MSLAAVMLPDPETTLEISPRDVSAWLGRKRDERPLLLDCREPEELDFCSIQGHEWLPLGDFPARWEALEGAAERGVVVYCHHGMRSLRAASFLRSRGIGRAFSMRGGIDAWSAEIDSTVPRY